MVIFCVACVGQLFRCFFNSSLVPKLKSSQDRPNLHSFSWLNNKLHVVLYPPIKDRRTHVSSQQADLLLAPLLAFRPHVRCKLNCTWKSELVGLTGMRRRLSTAQTSEWRPPWVFWARQSLVSLCLARGSTGITTYRGSFKHNNSYH